MSSTHLWAALQQSSLVGVDRLPVPAALLSGADASLAPTRQALESALQPPATSTAAQVLRASAVAAVLERAGWTPGAQIRLSQSLTLPALPAAESRHAPQSVLLLTLMKDVLEHGPRDLLAPMFQRLNEVGMRLSHELLVPALNEGRQSVELRAWLTPVLGERGRWLAALNPQWAYASGVQETANAEQIWQEGSIDQRVALLRDERAHDASQARTRLEGSLKELSAKERAPMVMALEISLSIQDEPLLEKLLTDRSKEVRESAARLLSRLPQSAHSQRITAWLQAMLSQGSKGEWQIEPPEEGHKDWERDGIALQPPAYIKGVKAWWLQQMVELAPLDFWMQQLGMTPEQLWEWSRRSDWKTALRQGWLAALRDQPDVRWIDLLQTMDRDARAESLLPAMLNQLSPEQREAYWLRQLQQAKGTLIDRINTLEGGMPVVGEFSLPMSERVMDELDKALGGKQATGSWHSWQADQAILVCARRLHAAVLPRFAKLWRQSVPAPEPRLEVAEDSESASATETAVMPRLTQLWRKLVSKTDAVVEEATAAVVVSTLTPEQQARLDRARLRPWDDAQVLAQLNRIVDLRMALHAELRS
ncbi:DUF5691 domain-containing protein [Comamonas suwonensis]|uniref:Uncharacterized protein n=1 Tax=Comamonas suwonensis TaxID=2606214 RepID=A0A843B3Z6_9BURK|nr:DUF5691 domain-containing protein [Comamonas suwonensis]MBI1626136.1 hypothetical protein [Comamonas suwonensis]